MGWKAQYGHPAAIPDTWVTFPGVWQWKGTIAKKPEGKQGNTGWWQPSLDVRLGAAIALATAQKKKAPGPAYLNISAPATSGTGSGGDEEC